MRTRADLFVLLNTMILYLVPLVSLTGNMLIVQNFSIDKLSEFISCFVLHFFNYLLLPGYCFFSNVSACFFGMRRMFLKNLLERKTENVINKLIHGIVPTYMLSGWSTSVMCFRLDCFALFISFHLTRWNQCRWPILLNWLVYLLSCMFSYNILLERLSVSISFCSSKVLIYSVHYVAESILHIFWNKIFSQPPRAGLQSKSCLQLSFSREDFADSAPEQPLKSIRCTMPRIVTPRLLQRILICITGYFTSFSVFSRTTKDSLDGLPTIILISPSI